jgi:alpha-N-acetylglucosamine transferase
MEKRLVFTVTSKSPLYQLLAKSTHPAMKAYADRCGADFKAITVPESEGELCCYNKWRVPMMLQEYDRVLYVDTDICIAPGAENIFDFVPVDKFGAYDELKRVGTLRDTQVKFLRAMGCEHAESMGKSMEHYVNAGMFLSSRSVMMDHAFLLMAVPGAYDDNMHLFKEQGMLNFNLQKFLIPVFDVGVKFNAFLGYADPDGKIFGVPIEECSFIHMAGMFHRAGATEKENMETAKGILAMLDKKLKGKGMAA